MKMKKLAAILMALTMSVSMLASCGGDDSSSKADSTADSSVADSSAADSTADSSEATTTTTTAEPEPEVPAGPATFSAFDESKLLYGDIEHNGKFRIELYNQYGDTAKDPAFDGEEIEFTGGISVTFDIAGITDQEREYDAYLMFTDAAWAWGSWNINDNNIGSTKIKGDGTYTVYVSNETCSTANPNYAESNMGTDAEGYAGSAWATTVFCVDIYELAAIEGLEGKDEATGEFDKGNITISNVKIEWWDEGAAPDYVEPVDTTREAIDETTYATFDSLAAGGTTEEGTTEEGTTEEGTTEESTEAAE